MEKKKKKLMVAPTRTRATKKKRKAGVTPRDLFVAASLWLIVCLNIFDATVTVLGLQHGFVVEENILMEVALDWGTWAFVSIKMTCVLLGCWLLWRLRHKKAAIVGIALCVTAYLVLAMHVARHFF